MSFSLFFVHSALHFLKLLFFCLPKSAFTFSTVFLKATFTRPKFMGKQFFSWALEALPAISSSFYGFCCKLCCNSYCFPLCSVSFFPKFFVCINFQSVILLCVYVDFFRFVLLGFYFFLNSLLNMYISFAKIWGIFSHFGIIFKYHILVPILLGLL